MGFYRRQRRSIAMFALLAMLALALAPTVSRAASLLRGSPTFADLCGADSRAAGAVVQLDHCPLCVLAAHAAGLPPAVPALQPPVALEQSLPALFLQSPRPLFAWHAAQPRAPPLLA